jgi:hypothetical protein
MQDNASTQPYGYCTKGPVTGTVTEKAILLATGVADAF